MVQPGWRVRQPLGIASSSASVRAIVDAFFFFFLEVLPDTNRFVSTSMGDDRGGLSGNIRWGSLAEITRSRQPARQSGTGLIGCLCCVEHDFDIVQSEPSRANSEASGKNPGWVAHTLPRLEPPVSLSMSSGVHLFHFHMLVDTLPVQVSPVYYLSISYSMEQYCPKYIVFGSFTICTAKLT